MISAAVNAQHTERNGHMYICIRSYKDTHKYTQKLTKKHTHTNKGG